MSQQPEMIVSIDEQGSISIEVIKGDGKNCLALSQPLENALGGVEDRKFKAEFRNEKAGTVQQRLTSR